MNLNLLKMKRFKKALLDSVISGGIMVIIALIIKVPIYKALVPISAVVIYSFIKAVFLIYRDNKANVI